MACARQTAAPSAPKLAALMDEAEYDVLAYMSFHPDHWTKISSTNPLERPNGARRQRSWPVRDTGGGRWGQLEGGRSPTVG
jgi:transposase-like protein